MDYLSHVAAVLTETWTSATFIAAILAGLGIGYVLLGALAIDPAYVTARAARSVGLLIGGTFLAAGLAFYATQMVVSAAQDDESWPRVVGRFGLWVVYAVCLGVGSWWRAREQARINRSHARARAIREIDGE